MGSVNDFNFDTTWLPPVTYILDENNDPVPCDDPVEWAFWKLANVHRCIVAKTKVLHKPPVEVSTVFLGFDRGFHCVNPNCPPILFESTVFGGEDEHLARQYVAWDEAERGHRELVEMVLTRLHAN